MLKHRRSTRQRVFENRKRNLKESIEYKDEMNASEFRRIAWSGAKDTLEDLSDADIDLIFDNLRDSYSVDELPTLTEINDFFWFERDTIAEWLGYSSYDELMEDRG